MWRYYSFKGDNKYKCDECRIARIRGVWEPCYYRKALREICDQLVGGYSISCVCNTLVNHDMPVSYRVAEITVITEPIAYNHGLGTSRHPRSNQLHHTPNYVHDVYLVYNMRSDDGRYLRFNAVAARFKDE